MAHFRFLLAALSVFVTRSYAANIFVSHYTGTITTLSFSPVTNELAVIGSLTIGGQPSWMHWDPVGRVIYTSDETTFGTATLNAVSAGPMGGLSSYGKTTTRGGGVACVTYGNEGYVAIAH